MPHTLEDQFDQSHEAQSQLDALLSPVELLPSCKPYLAARHKAGFCARHLLVAYVPHVSGWEERFCLIQHRLAYIACRVSGS